MHSAQCYDVSLLYDTVRYLLDVSQVKYIPKRWKRLCNNTLTEFKSWSDGERDGECIDVYI